MTEQQVYVPRHQFDRFCEQCEHWVEGHGCRSSNHRPCWMECPNCASRIELLPEPVRPGEMFRFPDQMARLMNILSEDAERLIGQVIVLFGMAESTLWSLLPHHPKHPFPSMGRDLRRLEELSEEWRQQPPLPYSGASPSSLNSAGIAASQILDLAKGAALYRHTLAHGTLMVDVLAGIEISGCRAAVFKTEPQVETVPYVIGRKGPALRIELTVEELERIRERMTQVAGVMRLLSAMLQMAPDYDYPVHAPPPN